MAGTLLCGASRPCSPVTPFGLALSGSLMWEHSDAMGTPTVPGSQEAPSFQDAPSLLEALREARAGSETGFRQLWRQLQPRLLRFLSVYGCEEPDDVASETWLQVVRDLHRFQGGEEDFRGWLFSIARHRAMDATRARTRFRDRLARLPVAEPDPGDKPVELEVLEGLSTRLAVALVAGLSRDQAEAVALRVIAGLDTPAVADILGKSPGSVRVALHRGLRTLAADPRIKTLAEVDQ
jgi:RNA polymerase sigma-70 factor (ECF subfamily)